MIIESNKYCLRCGKELSFKIIPNHIIVSWFCINYGCSIYLIHQEGVDNPDLIIQNPDVPVFLKKNNET